MINRQLIRLKTVQIIYAYYQNKEMDLGKAKTELVRSLANAYYLYNELLLLMVDIKRVAAEYVEDEQARYDRLGLDKKVNTRFIDNKFINQLSENKQLLDFHKSLVKDNNSTADLCNFEWRDREDLVRKLLKQIEETDAYAEYMAMETSTYEEDRDFWRKVYRTVLTNNDDIDEELEGLSLYWNDDKTIIDTFVVKTIKRFEESNGENQPLLPEYENADDLTFATDLLEESLTHAETYREQIASNVKNWNVERMPLMDIVIMQIALAEIISFPNIPLSVSINEYVEIAKMYSTPRSGGYVNGVLDAIAKKLLAENKLMGKKL